MKNIILYILLFALCPLLLVAQAPDTLWTRHFGGNEYEIGNSVLQTDDGGFIAVGETHSYGAGLDDIYIVRTDSCGDILWTKTYGGSSIDEGYAIQSTTDNGFIVCGSTFSFGPTWASNLWLLKLNSSGDTLWTKVYGTDVYEYGYSVRQTFDGGYIISGTKGEFAQCLLYLIKTDSLGDTLWSNTYGIPGFTFGYDVRQTTDRGYIVVGSMGASNNIDVYCVKADSLGDTLWTRTYGDSCENRAQSVQITSDGGYIIAGYSYRGFQQDIYVIRINAFGDTIWTRFYGDDSASDTGYDLILTSDSNYVIVGATYSYGAGETDVYLVKITDTGDTIWTAAFGGIYDDYGRSVYETNDGGYIVTGLMDTYSTLESDLLLLKTTPDTFGIKEQQIVPIVKDYYSATIISGPLLLPDGKNCKIFDITGRVVVPQHIKPGIYFIEIDGVITKKVVKVR